MFMSLPVSMSVCVFEYASVNVAVCVFAIVNLSVQVFVNERVCVRVRKHKDENEYGHEDGYGTMCT